MSDIGNLPFKVVVRMLIGPGVPGSDHQGSLTTDDLAEYIAEQKEKQDVAQRGDYIVSSDKKFKICYDEKPTETFK